MPKALIVNPYWPTLGGGERYTAAIVKLLLSRGWMVDILSPENYSAEIHRRFAIDISASSWQNKPFSSPLTFNYDLMFYVSDGSLPISFAKKTFIHLQFPFQHVGGLRPANFFKSRFYKFIVNSKFTKSFIDREYGVNSIVVYPPIDTDSFLPGKKQNLILYVGRFSNLTQSKGQGTLLEAFSHIHSKLSGWRLILAGGTTVGLDPAFMESLTARATGLPVEIITNPDFAKLKTLYGESKLFWSGSGYGFEEFKDPTRVEHFGISVVEAMAAGAVPLLTCLGGHREIVDTGVDGFLWDSLAELEADTLKLVNIDLWRQFSLKAIEKSKLFSESAFNSAVTKEFSL